MTGYTTSQIFDLNVSAIPELREILKELVRLEIKGLWGRRQPTTEDIQRMIRYLKPDAVNVYQQRHKVILGVPSS